MRGEGERCNLCKSTRHTTCPHPGVIPRASCTTTIRSAEPTSVSCGGAAQPLHATLWRRQSRWVRRRTHHLLSLPACLRAHVHSGSHSRPPALYLHSRSGLVCSSAHEAMSGIEVTKHIIDERALKVFVHFGKHQACWCVQLSLASQPLLPTPPPPSPLASSPLPRILTLACIPQEVHTAQTH